MARRTLKSVTAQLADQIKSNAELRTMNAEALGRITKATEVYHAQRREILRLKGELLIAQSKLADAGTERDRRVAWLRQHNRSAADQQVTQ